MTSTHTIQGDPIHTQVGEFQLFQFLSKRTRADCLKMLTDTKRSSGADPTENGPELEVSLQIGPGLKFSSTNWFRNSRDYTFLFEVQHK